MLNPVLIYYPVELSSGILVYILIGTALIETVVLSSDSEEDDVLSLYFSDNE